MTRPTLGRANEEPRPPLDHAGLAAAGQLAIPVQQPLPVATRARPQ
ncbi:hypothetical protein ACMA1D_02105 [Streptomyces sp. 796.1]